MKLKLFFSSPILLSLIFWCFIFTGTVIARDNTEHLPYLDYTLPVEVRVADLVSRLTLEEKASLLVNKSSAVPRLGIEEYNFWNEALHGVKGPGKFTVFPQAIAFGATWDPELIFEVATAISDEARGRNNEIEGNSGTAERGLLTFFSPTINMARDPRWGRTPETFGEDPYLTSRIGVAYIKGMQGDDPRYIKVVATAKHFAANNEEHNRFYANPIISERTLREYYFPAFRAAVTEGNVQSVMGAYNAINGIPCNANKWLLTDVLRGEWGFDGYVVTDCDALMEMTFGHKYTASGTEASAAAVNAGVDLECANMEMMRNGIVDALDKGLVTQEAMDRAVSNVLRARFRVGMFDPPELDPYTNIPGSVVGSKEHQNLALKASRESIVLLKNEIIGDKSILPLDARKIKSIAVVGPLADVPRFGDYSGNPLNEAVTPLGGINNKAGDEINVVHIDYVSPISGDSYVVIPPEHFIQSDDEQKRGMKAEYFSNDRLSGTPKTVRIDECVDIGDTGRKPHKALPKGPASIRWSGKLIPPVSGEYSLSIYSNGGVSLILEGKQILFREEEKKPEPKSGEPAGLEIFHQRDRDKRAIVNVVLKAGEEYDIVIEYTLTKGNPIARFEWIVPKPDVLSDQMETIRSSDVVIAVVGIGRDEEQEGTDRFNLDLPLGQTDYVRRVFEANPSTIVVLINGGPLSINWIQENIPAIVEAWYPGEQGGNAIADVLFGDYNPAGRLPLTFYESVTGLPPFGDYEISNGRTYMYLEKEPLYPFGYGLSYTTFKYANLSIDKKAASESDIVNVSLDVTNTGQIDGGEVVQLYVRNVESSVKMPLMQLKGFQRIHVEKGETQKVVIPLAIKDLDYWDEKENKFKVEPGEFEIQIGASSKDIRLQDTITVEQ